MRSEFRDLVAYQRATEVADYLYEAVGCWQPDDRWSLGRQLIRSADSVGANIAEASGRGYRNDQRRMLFIARGSLFETEHWIATAERRGLLQVGTTDRLTEIARALSGLIKQEGRT
jgi:four helix bundle protein